MGYLPNEIKSNIIFCFMTYILNNNDPDSVELASNYFNKCLESLMSIFED